MKAETAGIKALEHEAGAAEEHLDLGGAVAALDVVLDEAAVKSAGTDPSTTLRASPSTTLRAGEAGNLDAAKARAVVEGGFDDCAPVARMFGPGLVPGAFEAGGGVHVEDEQAAVGKVSPRGAKRGAGRFFG